VGLRGYKRLGKKKWRKEVAKVVSRLVAALEPEDVVLGGGNVKKLKELPPGCRVGNNANAFVGGFRLWNANQPEASLATKMRPSSRETEGVRHVKSNRAGR
jgi:polyphosphate glucokinase